MPTYTYSGLHPREGTIPVHTFYSDDGSKPVVAMEDSIVIDGHSLLKTQLEEVSFMLNAFQHFRITNIYRTERDYDYALLVENLDNDFVPAKLEHCVLGPTLCTGIIIDHDPRNKTYTVGCGPHIFTNVVSEFSCTDPSSEFSSVQVQTYNKFHSNICDYKVDITCMMDCILKDLPPYTSCSTLHEEQCSLPGAMAPLERTEASSTKIPEYTPNQLMTEYLGNCKSSTSSACAMRKESLMTGAEADSNSGTLMSLEEFEAYKPTISRQERRHQTEHDKLTVTVGKKTYL